jgi:hypothetical protein
MKRKAETISSERLVQRRRLIPIVMHTQQWLTRHYENIAFMNWEEKQNGIGIKRFVAKVQLCQREVADRLL